jgi:hypothetical protein
MQSSYSLPYRPSFIYQVLQIQTFQAAWIRIQACIKLYFWLFFAI